MNSTVKWIIAIIVVVAIVWYFYPSTNDTTPVVEEGVTTEVTETAENGIVETATTTEGVVGETATEEVQ